MTTVTERAPRLIRRPISFRRRAWRFALLTLGWLLMVVGVVGSILPGHLGLPLLMVGLIIVLRASRPARRLFIGLQRRHPRFFLPIRRLLRREPEVLQVAWQQVLRTERFLLPRTWRPARRIRRLLFVRRRPLPSMASPPPPPLRGGGGGAVVAVLLSGEAGEGAGRRPDGGGVRP
jgi:hypothetical protein